jgi:hypothetical protein
MRFMTDPHQRQPVHEYGSTAFDERLRHARVLVAFDQIGDARHLPPLEVHVMRAGQDLSAVAAHLLTRGGQRAAEAEATRHACADD